MGRIRKIMVIAAGGLAAGGIVAWGTVRPWWQRWGIEPTDADRPLPGDDVITNADTTDTRSIDIAASPAAIWPWLLQMGFGRGGWYSYDAVDMRGSSADRILPEFQALAVGDIVPTHPDGGFEVRVLEPGYALVLYMDAAMARAQAEAAKGRRGPGHGGEGTPANLKVAGGFMEGASPPDFAASWAFVLEPASDGGTRLVERVRVSAAGGTNPVKAAAWSTMGFGVFVMVRKQLLGIKRRVEAAGPAAEGSTTDATG
jgi:hypothetical protein